MKKGTLHQTLLIVLATLSLSMVTISAQPAGATNPSTDEAAIRENVRQLEVGWNTKSGSLFAKPFAEDADYVVINGMCFKGRTEIEKLHQRIFDTIFKNTTIRLSIKQIRFVRPDVAVVHINGHRDAPENERALVEDAIMTMVMTRGKNGWEIAAFQNTQVTAKTPR